MRALLVLMALAALPAAAQEPGGDLVLGQVQSAVLTVDPDQLFAASAYGQRVAAELRVQSETLAAENRRIEAELTAEERDLTTRRPSLTPDAFRAEAEAFDARVQTIRAEQDAKETALQSVLGEARDTFLRVAAPVLDQIMQNAGAAVILDRRSVVRSIGAVDITEQAIAAIDAVIGDGTTPAP